jgi:inner membrane protein
MASFGHVAVGLAAGSYVAGGGRRRELALAWVAFVGLSLLADLDVIAFAFGVPYAAPFGHRGASHSLAVALTLGGLIALWRPRIGVVAALVLASHGLLDTLTDGGRGVALFWPFSDERLFAPWRPIPVAPIGRGMLSPRGLHVVVVELGLFAPLWIYGLWAAIWRARRRPRVG